VANSPGERWAVEVLLETGWRKCAGCYHRWGSH
jgi:hypothetical protein